MRRGWVVYCCFLLGATQGATGANYAEDQMLGFKKAKKAKMRTSLKMDGHFKNPATVGKTGIATYQKASVK